MPLPPPDDAPRLLAGAGLGRRLPALIRLWRTEKAREGAVAAQLRNALSPAELSSASAALRRLQRGLTGERMLSGTRYMDDPELLGAYLLYYWPISYLEVSLALAELSLSPRRILDLGSGPGPGSAALTDAGARELVLADGSARALALAERALGEGADISTACLDLEGGDALPEGPFDLVYLGHSINELWEDQPDRLDRRRELLERCGELLSEEGAVLAIEPALTGTSRELLGLRDRLAAGGWTILGPCPGSYPCPTLSAGPGRSCHSTAPWHPPEPIESLARAAGLTRDAVKYSWFAARPPRAEIMAPPPGGIAAAWAGVGSGIPPGRIVSEPLLNKAGRLRYFLCGEGRLIALSARADDGAARTAGFFALRRGDRLGVESPEIREGGLGLGPASRLVIAARAPEPPPSEQRRPP